MKFRRIAATAAAVLLLAVTLIISACTQTETAKIKVTFDYNDGFSSPKTVEIDGGSAVGKPEDPARTGYSFVYWYSADPATEYNFSSPVTADLTLYAKWEEKNFVVTIFEYEGKTTPYTVADGDTFAKPKDPEKRDGYTFDGWYADESRLIKFNFAKPITSDVTIYAKWLEVGATYFNVSFNYNYTGSPAALSNPVKEGEKAVKPADPVRTGYIFDGWFTEAECKNAFDFNAPITADTQIYAGWTEIKGVKTYKFDAELCDLSALKGTGYSNEAEKGGMIQREVGNKPEASNGFWVGYMYIKGCSLTFEFESEEEISDATLKLRLSAEFVNELVLKSDEFTVELNGKKIDYSDIHITGIDAGISAAKHPFKDFTVGENLTLKAGKNTVVLTVNNNKPMAGTDGKPAGGKIAATAPLIDCIKVVTSAALSWMPNTKELIDKYKWWDFDTEYKGYIEE